MSAAASLALLTIAMLPLTALRLELNFRRNRKPRPRPELRVGPAGGYLAPALREKARADAPAFSRFRIGPA